MKIAIPTDARSMEAEVCQSFGRAPYFVIFDTESKETTFLDNSAAASQGGAGIKAAQSIVDSKVSVLITPRCGENAAQVLKAADVKMYKSMKDSILNNFIAFSEGKLSPLEEIHPGFHGNEGK